MALLHNGAVVYVDARADVHGAGGPANGYFEYMHREGDGDVLFLHFSSRGIPEAMRSTVLRRVDGSAVWRAVGDGVREYTDDDVYIIAQWHIVAVMLS